MALRPQTLYGIADSPIGLAAWMLDYNAESLQLISRTFDGEVTGLTRDDDVLDGMSLFWLTNSAISCGAHLLGKQDSFLRRRERCCPCGSQHLSRRDLLRAPQLAKRAYPNLIHYNKVKQGGHFAAWEQPQIFSDEVRAGFRSLRN
jgi:hypothetical protein